MWPSGRALVKSFSYSAELGMVSPVQQCPQMKQPAYSSCADPGSGAFSSLKCSIWGRGRETDTMVPLDAEFQRLTRVSSGERSPVIFRSWKAP